MRRLVRKWTTHKLQEQRGAVTVFLVVIFASLLILAGLIVDAARILVAERKVDSALQSATRSVLAGSDSELTGQFGLYGVDCTSKVPELERYLKNNLVERHQGFSFIDYRIEKTALEVLPVQTLLNNEVFEQQILAYMKYKAPLQITENVVQKFRQGLFNNKAQVGQKATEAAKQSKVVRNKTTAVNKVINRKGGTFQRGARDRIKELNDLQDNLAQIKGELALYGQITAESAGMLQQAGKEIGEEYKPLNISVEVQFWEEKILNLTSSILQNAKLMEEIMPLEDKLEALQGEKGEGVAERRSDLRNQIQSLANKWQVLEEINLPVIKINALNSKDIQAKKRLMQQINNLFGAKLTSEEVATSLISTEDFRKANQKTDESEVVNFTINDPEADLAKINLDNDLAEASGLALFQLASGFTEGLEVAIQDGGEKLSICEYIMDKYTFATTRTERGHYFQLGEVEYILCGNAAELTNVGEMFLKIFVLRVAIDSLDAFLKSTILHPAARLAEALVSGFSRACLDMRNLYAGQPIELTPSVSQPTLAYSDHLRLFLLLQDKNTQLDRMRQLIQVNVRGSSNGKFALLQQSSSFTARTEVSINLLFLPALHLDKLGYKGFTSDRYTISQDTVAGY